MLGVNWASLGPILGTVITSASAILVAVISNHRDTIRQIGEVKTEVKTANASSLAQLGDAAESRRIDQIPRGDRTLEEQTHIERIPPAHPGES